MTRAWPWIALAVALGAGCSGPSAYPCSSSAQCVSGGEQGTCADGYCAFPDPSCPGGSRYEPNAGAGLGGTCVPQEAGPDAGGACGAEGQACCAQGPACADHLRCEGGTCASCVTELALGRRFSCMLVDDGTVWCAGASGKGQLGNGTAGMPSATRVQVRDAMGPITDATAIGAGNEHACAVRAGGAVWCWGANDLGQLGNNAPLSPAPPPQLTAVPVVMANGQPLTGIVEVGGGMRFTCARDGAGGVWCWGDNLRAALGDGTTTTRSAAAPVLAAPMGAPFTGALDLYVGGRHSCVRRAGDEVWCWGGNFEGQFGDGTTANYTTPALLATTRSVAVARRHTCFVEADTTITCAGWDGHARLGSGVDVGTQGQARTTREKVLAAPGGAPFTGAVEVVAGAVTCALMEDTGVACWGASQYGQTGTGQGEVVPARVRAADGTELRGVSRLVAGFPHVCAFTTAGEILCWGRNHEGDLGDGTFANRGFPSRIEHACR